MFSSFFAAFAVAGAYGYYNYKFSRFHFVDFSELVFYTGDGTVFEPVEESYILFLYSSLQGGFEEFKSRINNSGGVTILVVDLAQTRRESADNVIYITAGINTLLPLIRRFNVLHSPSVMLIKREKGTLFKQESRLEKL